MPLSVGFADTFPENGKAKSKQPFPLGAEGTCGSMADKTKEFAQANI